MCSKEIELCIMKFGNHAEFSRRRIQEHLFHTNENLHYENEQDSHMSSKIHEENGDSRHDLDLLHVYCTD